MEKRKILSLGLAIFVVLTFSVGYYIWKKNKNTSLSELEKSYDELAISANSGTMYNKEALNKVIEKGYEILFEVKSGDNGKFIVERRKTADEEKAVGKKGIELQSKYKDEGYVLKDIENNKVELIRDPIKYEPNRYVLLSENNEIVIGKSDENGNIFDKDGNILNREGTGTKITSLREKDIENIIKGDISMQFETIEKLNDGIKDFDIKYEMPE